MPISEAPEYVTNPTRKKALLPLILLILFITLSAGSFFVFNLTQPPGNTETQTVIEVEKGMSVRTIASIAKENGLVKSELFLYAVITSLYDPTNIHAGTYVFTEPTSVFKVAKKIASSDVNQTLVTLTFPEGVRLTQIADIASSKLPAFDSFEYLNNTADQEGYLFPETYFVPDTFTATDLIELQRSTYEENISPLREQIEASPFTEYEVLILASIIEREANSEESMKMVSGILQNRISIGMALQTDASMEYVLDKPLAELLPEDLDIDSPYNTYLYTGLTPTPIGNPGIMSIKAVLEPTLSEYIFYITGYDGAFHYAETLRGHNLNIDRYLR